jgi:hypothetical protein
MVEGNLIVRTRFPVLAARLARALLCRRALLDKGRREGRAPAGTRDPVCNKRARGGPQVSRDIPAFPARMVLTVSFVLSLGSDALLPPSPCRFRCAARSGRLHHGRLDASLRASGPHDFSVRGRRRLSLRGLACARPRSRRQRFASAVSSAAREKAHRKSALPITPPRRRCRVHRRPARVS